MSPQTIMARYLVTPRSQVPVETQKHAGQTRLTCDQSRVTNHSHRGVIDVTGSLENRSHGHTPYRSDRNPLTELTERNPAMANAKLVCIYADRHGCGDREAHPYICSGGPACDLHKPGSSTRQKNAKTRQPTAAVTA